MSKIMSICSKIFNKIKVIYQYGDATFARTNNPKSS